MSASLQSWFNAPLSLAAILLATVIVVLWFLNWLLFPRLDSTAERGEGLAGLDGLDDRLATRLKQFGVDSDRKLVQLSSRGQLEVESLLGLHHGEYDRWRAQVLERWRQKYLPPTFRDRPHIQVDPDLGATYTKRPEQVDDLSKLPGLDAVTINRLHLAGIYTFEQLESQTSEQRANLQRRFGIGAIDFDHWPSALLECRQLEQLRAGLTRHGSNRPADATVASSDPPGIHPTGAPSPDDFLGPSHSPGPGKEVVTDAVKAESAVATGLANVGHTSGMGSPSGSSHRVDTAHLGPQADGGNQSTREVDRQLRPVAPTGHSVTSSVANALGATSVATVAAITSREPVTQSADELGETVTDSDVTTGAARIDVREGSHAAISRDGSLTGSGDSGPGSSPATEGMFRSDLGMLYQQRPAKCDDLTRLFGIDGVTAGKLNVAGIYTYAQLAELDPLQQETLRSKFGLCKIDFADWRRCITAWRNGIETSSEAPRQFASGWLHGIRLPEVVPGVFDGAQLVAYAEQVVFRGTDPKFWGTDCQQPRPGVLRAVPSEGIRTDINYVRLRRTDTRESVVIAITKGQLFAPGGPGQGWNGVCDEFFGGRHLGIYSDQVPHEVETRYGMGGWGFGHRYDENDHQQCGWAGRYIEPTGIELSVGRIGAMPGTIVFRGSDPSIWNRRVREGQARIAIPLANVSHEIRFVRIMRVDTGEGVIVPVNATSVLRLGEDRRFGWNGLNDHFAGGYHLGVYHQQVPAHVETRFGVGGWGFGHPFAENDRQAYGWAGHRLPETVFEISVMSQLPEFLRPELLG